MLTINNASLEFMNRVFVRAGENDNVNIVDLATKSEISGTG